MPISHLDPATESTLSTINDKINDWLSAGSHTFSGANPENYDIDVTDAASLTAVFTNLSTGDISFFGTVDGSTYYNVNATDTSAQDGQGYQSAYFTFGHDQRFFQFNTVGFNKIRLRSVGSTATVNWSKSAGDPSYVTVTGTTFVNSYLRSDDGIYLTGTTTGAKQALDVALYDDLGNQITSFGGGTEYDDGDARGSATGKLMMGDDGTNIQSVKVDASGELQVDVLTLPNVTIGAAIPAGTNNIGDVDVLTLPAIPAGNNNIGDVDVASLPGTVATDITAIKTAVEIIDNAIAGSEMQVDVLTMPTVTVSQGTGTNLHTVVDSGTITTVSTVTNLSQLGGTAISMNTGVRDAGTQRVTIATDDSVPVSGTITANAGTGTFSVANSRSTNPIYAYTIPSQVHVAGANTVHWDMFNADATKVVRVLSVLQIPNITTAVTGIVFDWKLARTTAVGTGGSTLTAWLADTDDTALDADITARSKPTGGATEGTILRNYSLSSEETNAGTIQVASMGGLELIPDALGILNNGKGIVLRQNQGLRCVQITSSAAGNTGWLIVFTME